MQNAFEGSNVRGPCIIFMWSRTPCRPRIAGKTWVVMRVLPTCGESGARAVEHPPIMMDDGWERPATAASLRLGRQTMWLSVAQAVMSAPVRLGTCRSVFSYLSIEQVDTS